MLQESSSTEFSFSDEEATLFLHSFVNFVGSEMMVAIATDRASQWKQRIRVWNECRKNGGRVI